MSYKIGTALLLATLPVLAVANPDEVCPQAADKIEMVIDDWYQFVKDYNAESKNPSVVAMYSDVKAGKFKTKFTDDCRKNWATHSEIFTCFSGIASEMGAAMCLHPDTNKADWQY